MARSRAKQAAPSLLDPPEVRTTPVATVALLKPIDKPYSYRIPGELGAAVRPGMRITVPFGRRDVPTAAFCLSVSEEAWDSTLKPVLGLIDDEPLLDAGLLELGQWTARYYAAPLGRTLDLMVPDAAKRQAGWRRVRFAVLAAPVEGEGDVRRSAKQAAVLSALASAGGELPIARCAEVAGCAPAVITAMARKGSLSIVTRRQRVEPDDAGIERHEPDYELNEDQARAVDQIAAAVDRASFCVHVLFGVTGSGKTEVYISAMRRALAAGRQAIMLVPEIALTTQTVRRLQQRFDRVATIHSGLSGVQRSRVWAAVRAGDIPVVIGTQSAVFAPCPKPGIIIVDEEAEPSYKSLSAPRYHTRDIAVKRGHILGVPVVLGSATPSLETWHNLQHKKHYHLIRLPHRVRGLAMPKVHLVDMRIEQHARRGTHLLSRAMEMHLTHTLDRKEQAVLLLNRRGYASYLQCARCESVVTCARCSANMVFHATSGMAHCHYCQAKTRVPDHCLTVGCDGALVRFGMGTQRVEEELKRKFPNARVRRIDSDIMKRAGDYAEMLGAFERKEFDILVGTQMVAKGLDFPFVSFVGVVSADTALALDDFRSEERTFQLVLQVAGRSGRGDVAGEVAVQTFAAETAAILHAVGGDYEGFAESELANRRAARLPPYSRLVRVVLADERITKLRSAAEAMTERLRGLLAKRSPKGHVFDPRPSAIGRIRERYRYDILLVFPSAGALLSAMDTFRDEGSLRANVKSVTVDVDPVSMQ